jgi:FKBP-type peptidyl-prolyl cis-trans isomerase
MHTFTFRPRLESLEDRTTPATIGQIQAAAAETQYLAAQIRTIAHDFQWMGNPRFRSFVENYAKNVWFDGTVEIKTFQEAITSLRSQVAARPALAGVLGPQIAHYAQLQAQARSNMAFAQNIGAWLGFAVVPAPAPIKPTTKATNVTSPTADGTYSAGATIQITATFNKAVVVTGTPKIALNSGGTANFSSGSGSTTLTFTYTVGAADVTADLDYSSVNALTLNGGTIVDQSSGLVASLKLPTLGAAGSLGANKNIVVALATDAGMTNTMPDPNDPSWVAGANGLKTWDVVVGTGAPVAAGSSITVFYTGWLASDGTQFDARRSPSAPITFALSGLIQGWQQGIPGMQPGGIRRLFVPAALGYGAAGSPPNIPPNADLVFELKLISTT